MSTNWPARVDALDWARVSRDLDARGSAIVDRLLNADECDTLASTYALDGPFRSRVVMARHGFGSGEYKYFNYPLPAAVHELRTARAMRRSSPCSTARCRERAACIASTCGMA